LTKSTNSEFWPALKPQIVVDGDGYLLLGAKVAFGGLDGGVAEQELDLFEVSAVFAAEFRAGAAQIVGAETLDSDGFRRLLDHAPHRPIAQFLSHDAPTFGDSLEQSSGTMAGGSRPSVHQELDPHGDGHRANAAAFAAEIGDHPAAFALLNILYGERGQLSPTQHLGVADRVTPTELTNHGRDGLLKMVYRFRWPDEQTELMIGVLRFWPM